MLRAVQVVLEEGLARPIVIGRPQVLARRIEQFGLRLNPGADFEVVNPESDERYRDYWMAYHKLTERKGVTPPFAKVEMRRRFTLIGAMMIHMGDADGMICGTFGTNEQHLQYIDQIIGKRPGVNVYAGMNGLILQNRQVFIVDTHVNLDPNADEIAEIAIMAADELKRFGIAPKVALLSHSNFGSSDSASALKMRHALALIQARSPDLEVDGEMHGDAALDADVRKALFPNSRLIGEANLLVMPNMDAANIAYNLLKTTAGGGIAIGPVLLGAARAAHILTPSATVRRIVNMTALAVVDAQSDKYSRKLI